MIPKLRKIYHEINENLNISCSINDEIYFIKSRKLFKINAETQSTSLIFEDIDSEMLITFNSDILSLFGNLLTLITKDGSILLQNSLSNKPRKIIYQNNDRIIIFLYEKENFFEVLTKDYDLKRIKIIGKSDEDILDISFSDDKAFILTQKTKVYETRNFLRTGRLKLENPICKLVSDGVFSFEEEAQSLIYRNEIFYLGYNDGFEVLTKSMNLLQPLTYYKSDNKFFKLFSNENNVYFIDKGLFLLENIPIKIINDEVKVFYGKFVICKNFLIFIDGFEIKNKNQDNSSIHYLPETDVNKRVDDLFEIIEFDSKNVSTNTSIENKFDLLQFKIEVNDFRKKYLDKFEIILSELESVKNTLDLKRNEIKVLSKELQERMSIFEQKKQLLLNRFVFINKKFDDIRKLKLNKISIPNFEERVKSCKRILEKMTPDRNKKLLDILRIQRNILKSFLY